jgi:hypothetical protein
LTNQAFTFVESTFQSDEELERIIHDEKSKSEYFDLTNGLVFRCHIVYSKEMNLNDLICSKDLIILNFHHGLFDYPSMKIFINDLNQAYSTGELILNDLRYLDCKY